MNLDSRRYNDVNKIASIVAHKIAPKNGQRIQAKASETAIISQTKGLSWRTSTYAEFGDCIVDHLRRKSRRLNSKL
jgi:hypothetical protein